MKKIEFTVRVSKETDGFWAVEVTDVDGTEFAKTFSKAAYEALRQAMPYMECNLDSLTDAV